MASEIDGLTRRYRLLSVALMDNLLPARQSPEIFARLQALKKDLSLFGEIRATTPLATLGVMRAAGVQEVQIGIEALSTRLLRKLNKGTTAIQNLEIMKHCEALGIENRANLLCGFPGSDDQDVAETLATLDFALPFRPPKTVYFWLGTGSPVWQQPERFGIRGVANHPRYRALFPPKTLRRITFITQGYRGDQGRQRARWRPVEKKVRGWAAVYAALHRAPASPPILGYRDGGDFLIIRQRRPGADTQTHRLANTSRAIYLFCEQNRSLAAITRRFYAPGRSRNQGFFKHDGGQAADVCGRGPLFEPGGAGRPPTGRMTRRPARGWRRRGPFFAGGGLNRRASGFHSRWGVTSRVCSNWAESEPSAVTAVHRSSRTRSSLRPRLIIGSMVNTIPGTSTTPCPLRP